MPSLDPGEVHALVQLRALLEHARQAARTTSPVARLTALVLLDAVNERVTHLAAQSLPNVKVGTHEKFEDLYSKVKEELAGAWGRGNRWADVRQLHRTRNNAQHEGVGGDPTLLPGWVSATEKYTRSLVLAAFGASLDDVWLADAVGDPEMAADLRAAEQHLRAGTPAAALASVKSAFAPAFRRWLGKHSSAHSNPFDTSLSRSFQELRQLEEMISRVRDLAAAQAFATDPAEYAWFAELRKADPETVTAAEAERALVFAFWWIVRWEAVDATWLSDADRRRRWAEQQRDAKTRRASGPARIDAMATDHSAAPGKFFVRLTVTDLPPADMYQEWSTAVRTRLQPLQIPGATWWHLEETGDIAAHITVEADTDALVTGIRKILLDAENDAAREAERRRQALDRERKSRAEFAREISERRHDLPGWVEDARLPSREDSSGRLRLGITLADDAGEHIAAIRDLLHRHHKIKSADADAHGVIMLPPDLTAPIVISVLRDISPQVEAFIEKSERRRAERHEAAEALNARLRASLHREGSPWSK